ncbi:phosphoribosylglycinamide formyltransferase [Euryarchaeota archaeon ex4484_178]|nr:MAG: phosphoribosylglycinamide formyltransferase [Euryarchaeota archaeon ex4484_178]
MIEIVGAEDVDRVADSLKNIGIYYQDGSFKRRVFKIVVLVSGRGTNLQAIIDAIKNRELNARIVAVISNKKKAYALKRAEKNGIEAIYLPAKKGESREDYDKRLAQIIDEKEPDLIVLAGFMRILSPWFVRKYPNKIINIHPALLPSFAGLYGENVHRAVIEYGCKVSGCTVHFVDEEVDHGPIIVQKCVEVKDDDTPQSLASRILEREHEALVEAIRLISEGRVKIVGRRVIIS